MSRLTPETVNAIVDYQYTGKFRSYFIRNISKNGLYVETYGKLTRNERVVIHNTRTNQPTKISGRILWSNQKGAGITFEESRSPVTSNSNFQLSAT